MNSQIKNYRNFFIKTLGCKVNQYESQAMREALVGSGFNECLTKEIADIYILNTCTVTGQADKESRHWIGLFHRTNPKARIVVTGCYVERDAETIKFLPGISHILNNEDKNRIAEILNSPLATNQLPITNHRHITDFKGRAKAFVKIQDGCENFCSYCKVPLVRGRSKSRPIDEILEETNALVCNGFKEIVLTGICLGAWGRDLPSSAIAQELGINGMSLVDVLRELNKAPGDFRIRLSSIEPAYVTDELIDYVSQNKRVSRHLHIPLQSGDDAVLKAMNRSYTAKHYRSVIEKARARIKDIAITTDVLVGFPGESDSNFRNTVSFIKEILPSRTHIFTFSKRYGTAAYDMAGAISNDILEKRYCAVKAAALSASYLYRMRFLGEKLNVLVETRRDKHSRLLTGYSDNYIKVLFEGPDELMKKIVPVRIKEANLLYTFGEYEPRPSNEGSGLQKGRAG